jgi:hypothetical protein
VARGLAAVRRTAIPSWLAGLVAATAVLIAIGVVSIGVFASPGGFLIAGAPALMVGVAAGAAPILLTLRGTRP